MDRKGKKSTVNKHLAQKVRQACILAARESFKEASMSGLCAEGAIEAAIGAMQSLDLESIIARETQSE